MSRHPPFQLKHFRRMTDEEWREILATLPSGASAEDKAKSRRDINSALEVFFERRQEVLVYNSVSAAHYKKIIEKIAELEGSLRHPPAADAATAAVDAVTAGHDRIELFSNADEFDLCARILTDLRRLDLLCRRKIRRQNGVVSAALDLTALAPRNPNSRMEWEGWDALLEELARVWSRAGGEFRHRPTEGNAFVRFLKKSTRSFFKKEATGDQAIWWARKVLPVNSRRCGTMALSRDSPQSRRARMR